MTSTLTSTNTNPDKNAPIMVNEHRIACDGGGGAMGHPKVFMDMGQDNQVRCKYCDRVFQLASDTPH